ncbi:MAG: hypothetical protein LBT78_01715 [Tannerella sp.]|jgi:hypothetical protein|nr:hypothetical protein [Tannerella sp.]
MKTFYVILAGIILSCLSATSLKAGDIQSKVKGKWEVSVPDAPSEYRLFSLEIKEKEQSLVIDLKGGDVDLKNQKVTVKDGKVTANVYVGEYVQLTVWEEKGVIKGSADTSMGKLSCNFKKVK